MAAVTFADLDNAVRRKKEALNTKVDRHYTLQTFCRAGAAPLAWLAAALAGLSGLSIADDPETATRLAILTVLVTTLGATLKPAEAATRHGTAALMYERLWHRLDSLALFELADGKKPVPEKKLAVLRPTLDKIDEDTLTADQESLPVGPEWFWDTLRYFGINPESRPLGLGGQPHAA